MKYIKTFETYNDNPKKEYIEWEELPIEVKNDIVENLFTNIEYLQKNYWNPDALRDMIDDSVKQPKFKIQYKNVNELYRQLEDIGWGISENQVKRLIEILKKGYELDPIILNNGNFFDGGHRLTSYKRLDKEFIPAIDIGFLLNFDWEKWDNGEVEL